MHKNRTGGGSILGSTPAPFVAYSLWPSTSGPATPVAYSGNFISGMNFTVQQGGMWLQGYRWWVCPSGQSLAPVKCCLWAYSGGGVGAVGGSVVPGSIVTSAPLKAGQWNYIPLAVPVQLSIGESFIAAIGCNGNFPDTTNYWGTTAPNGIVQGPLYAYGPAGTSYYAGGTANPDTISQGCFGTGSSDPTASPPLQTSGTDNFWVDVQVATNPGVVYNGTWRLWPNRIDADMPSGPDDLQPYIVGTEIITSRPVTARKIWYYVPSNAAQIFANQADIWLVNPSGITGVNVVSIPSPAWFNMANAPVSGTSWPGGWVYCNIPCTPSLPIGDYRVSVYASNGASAAWSTKRLSYWGLAATYNNNAVVGSAGIRSGPLFAPYTSIASTCYSFQGASPGIPVPTFTEPGQSPFQVGPPDSFPNLYVGVNSPGGTLYQNYWIDLEVT